MKTINESAKEANGYGYPNFTGVANEAFDSGFKSGIEFAERWISVEEEEPINREKVLIKWLKDGREIKSCGSLVLDSSLGKYWQSGGATQLTVTHWRPFERS
jgi:hypothetical protein